MNEKNEQISWLLLPCIPNISNNFFTNNENLNVKMAFLFSLNKVLN